MSSIVLNIVSVATGTVVNSVCDHVAGRLRHGDCTDEKCRQLIVRELDEIKTKIDGLARKDLQSSVCFLKDGLCLLNHAFEGAANDIEDNKPLDSSEQSEDSSFALAEHDDELRSQISAFNKALARSPQTLTVRSKERFTSAKLSFENAYSKATEAFNNEALSTTERILATKLRVVSRMLQCLHEDPEMAMAFCKLYLQQLHELPAVRKRFVVFFRNKVKSKLSQRKRGENIRCVMELSYALYEYAKLFARTGLDVLGSWPIIKLRRKAINPLLMPNKVLKKMLKHGVRSPNQFLFDQIDNSSCIAVNSKGEIVAKNNSGNSLEVLGTDSKVLGSFCFDSEADGFEILALATDSDDFVYAVTRYKNKSHDLFCYKLYIFGVDLGYVEKQFYLECLTGAGEGHHIVCLAVCPSSKNILVTKQDDAKVFVFYPNGESRNSFGLQAWNLIRDLEISARGEVAAAELVGKTVGIYTQDGTLKHEITLPGLHKVCGLAFDRVDNTVVVLTEVLTGCFHEYRLLSYSESGELLRSLVLPRQKKDVGYHLTSHPKGPLAVVHKTGVIFLHH
ncbi:uncharacterized protein LOC114517095 [Dendronephthya gigantea]|uniref:uncharacterized protein LOC114517095 n=1 Tax=Dendronephthya gigantea TaxID=151771 RepID=UPI0010695F37|nr:uncharacterized protein LOC114517095 [Dendronephthya gigantea]